MTSNAYKPMRPTSLSLQCLDIERSYSTSKELLDIERSYLRMELKITLYLTNSLNGNLLLINLAPNAY